MEKNKRKKEASEHNYSMGGLSLPGTVELQTFERINNSNEDISSKVKMTATTVSPTDENGFHFFTNVLTTRTYNRNV